jgi:hypothetical protein
MAYILQPGEALCFDQLEDVLSHGPLVYFRLLKNWGRLRVSLYDGPYRSNRNLEPISFETDREPRAQDVELC